MKVLHNFRNYLPNSQNWAYRLLSKIPNVELYIHADQYHKTNYYHPDWHFLNYSSSEIKVFHHSLSKSNLTDLFYKVVFKYLLSKRLQKWVNQNYLKSIKEHKVQVIHSHFGPVAVKYNPLIEQSGIPHVISFYGFDYEMAVHNNPQLLEEYRRLFKTVAAFICEGAFGASILEKYGCPKEKIHVVHLGLDFTIKEEIVKKKVKNTLKLVQIANYTEKKGHIYTVEAFGKVLKKCPNMHLTIVGGLKDKGEAWIEEKIKNLIDEYELHDNISLVKGIDFSKLYDYLRQYDVFIHPSCYAKNMDCEGGAPVVILDAQSVGLPVISTQHCDIPNEVTDKKTGLLANEKDVEEIAKHIETFYSMEELTYEEFSLNAIRHVQNNYDVNKSAIQLSNIYGSIIDSNSK